MVHFSALVAEKALIFRQLYSFHFFNCVSILNSTDSLSVLCNRSKSCRTKGDRNEKQFAKHEGKAPSDSGYRAELPATMLNILQFFLPPSSSKLSFCIGCFLLLSNFLLSGHTKHILFRSRGHTPSSRFCTREGEAEANGNSRLLGVTQIMPRIWHPVLAQLLKKRVRKQLRGSWKRKWNDWRCWVCLAWRKPTSWT